MGPIIGFFIFYSIYTAIILISGQSRTSITEMIFVGTLVFSLLISVANYQTLNFEEVSHGIKMGLHSMCLLFDVSCLIILIILATDNNLQKWKVGIYTILEIGVTIVCIVLSQLDTIRYLEKEGTLLLHPEYHPTCRSPFLFR